MNDYLRRVLLIDNPWLEGESRAAWIARHLPEPYVPRRLRLEADERVALVVGPRQAGKSTLIWKNLAAVEEPTLYLNCEEPSVRDWLRSPAGFLGELQELADEVSILFFEEIQNLPEAGLFLKGLVDRRTGRRIYATGSSSFDLESATRESLAGRARRHLLLPLSVAEVADRLTGSRLAREEELSRQVGRMMIFGSYPPVYTASEPRRELAGLVEAFVVRDASDRFRIRHTAAFRRLLELAASQVGNLCNYSEWAALCGVSNDTVAEYCHLLEQTHVLRLLRPFVGGKRAEITRARKAFFLDNGIRNQLFGGFGPPTGRGDRGALVENLVFTELAKALNPLLAEIYYWRSRSGAEVDFVVESQGRLVGCEVKAGDARGKVSRSARSFIEAYQPESFLVVNRGGHPDLELGDTRVRFLQIAGLEPFFEGFPGP